jgi:hypothetical protein
MWLIGAIEEQLNFVAPNDCECGGSFGGENDALTVPIYGRVFLRYIGNAR